jgi:hypothetical protein
MSDSESRRRWVTFGEIIALAALIISGLGLWLTYKSSQNNGPTRVVEQKQAIPLTLRGTKENDGQSLVIAPVEATHALESLRITIAGASPIEVGSDGELDAGDVEAALKGRDNEPKDQTLPVRVRIDARYVEAGKDRKASGTYTLRYMWKGGGLLGGRSLHLVGLSRG